ncbi:rCG45973 [Rattus norvegicus]|uniref:RCG45973 n=1 Tax=Rattus norvegicus TaxID=10116 RepID=A6IDM0_RAT|nr:rCG45973 [Rattus norvegicus]
MTETVRGASFPSFPLKLCLPSLGSSFK